MVDRNEVIVVGVFAWAPEIKYLANGDATCRAKIRTKRTIGTREVHDYVPVTAWRELAEELGRGRKDGRVGIKGHVRTWKAQDGKYVTEVEVERVRYPENEQPTAPPPQPIPDDDIPF